MRTTSCSPRAPRLRQERQDEDIKSPGITFKSLGALGDSLGALGEHLVYECLNQAKDHRLY